MQSKPTSSSLFRGRILPIIAGLHVEIGILVFCGLVLLGVGRTQGPVFDTVGPDFLPSAVAILVAALVLVQVVRQVYRELRDTPAPLEIHRQTLIKTSLFILVTILFVFLLSRGVLPLYLASSAFMTCTTVLLSQRPGWRDAVYGAVAGLALGALLQYVFTQILFIDLPG
jgi:uncharacterized BrkB/YihY/UPF0761 family membrane protein